MNMRTFTNVFVAYFAVIALSITAALSSWSSAHSGKNDIVDTAVSAGSFSTLVAAVKAAGLVETLKGEGPFTVFAPTDEAFKAIPEETLDALLKDKEALSAILTYHVVPGNVMAKDVVKVSFAKTVNGQEVSVVVNDGKVLVDGATVVKTDIGCTNGVIHVIDTVIMPKDIVDRAAGVKDFSTLVAAVKAAGLVETLKGDGPFTIFAPTNDAFAALPEGTVESLLKPENIEKLTLILTYHVVGGKVLAKEVVNLEKAKTVQGQDVMIKVNDGTVMINGAKVLKTDVLANNGVIHVIDSVLLPKDDDKIGMIRDAIRKGAPLYNQGHVTKCVDTYRETTMRLLQSSQMPEEAGLHLTRALHSVNHVHNEREQAWILRMGLENAFVSLNG
jgi:uncharacterized surface protein with fasciclin (FAS1) repeats